jgi:hypothetical protein
MADSFGVSTDDYASLFRGRFFDKGGWTDGRRRFDSLENVDDRRS